MTQLLRIFSGIQPTGVPHLGNYYGALVQWLQLAQERAGPTPIYAIVDVHAYTSRRLQFGRALYSSILDTTASLLAIGLAPNNCLLFRQSDVLEHYYLDNVFDNFISTQRLARMTQYKERIADGRGASAKSVPNGLLTYPVLQAADILLYQANLVPVGEDQTQHIELTRDIARRFNESTNSQLFPEPKPLLSGTEHGRRIRSLRNPGKKMSKSDEDKKSFIEIVDEPDVILEKVKKAVTDSDSRIFYDAASRPGISNLMRLHHLTTGQSFEEIERQYEGVESAKYKLELADILIEKLAPIRQEFKRVRGDQAYLEETLRLGCERARPMAEETVTQVKRLLGSLEPTK